jgi:hypothetical protein
MLYKETEGERDEKRELSLAGTVQNLIDEAVGESPVSCGYQITEGRTWALLKGTLGVSS